MHVTPNRDLYFTVTQSVDKDTERILNAQQLMCFSQLLNSLMIHYEHPIFLYPDATNLRLLVETKNEVPDTIDLVLVKTLDMTDQYRSKKEILTRYEQTIKSFDEPSSDNSFIWLTLTAHDISDKNIPIAYTVEISLNKLTHPEINHIISRSAVYLS